MRPVASLREICLGGGRWDWTRGGSYRLRTLLLREHRGGDVITLDDSTRGLTSLEIIGGTHMDLTALGAVEPLARLELQRIRRVSGMAALRPGRLDELWLEAIGTVDEPRALLTEHPRDVYTRPRSPFVEATREQPVAIERGWTIGPSKVG